MLTLLAAIFRRFSRYTIALHVCSWCGRLEGYDDDWPYCGKRVVTSHTYCDRCAAKREAA